MRRDFIDELCSLALAFAPAGIEWAVVDAVAANFYRDQVRSTSDLDIMLTLEDQSIDTVTSALRENGWTSITLVDGGLVRAQTPDGERLDVLVASTQYEKGAIARAQQFDLSDSQHCKTLAVEDVLIMKLLAGRFQDYADIESILATRPDLNWDYMSRWIEEFELEDRLQSIEGPAVAADRLSSRISRKPGRGVKYPL